MRGSLRVEAHGYAGRIVAIPPVRTERRLDIALLPESTCYGVVHDPNGAPAEGVVVTLFPLSEEQGIPSSEITDHNGAFQANGRSAGNYMLFAVQDSKHSADPTLVTLPPEADHGPVNQTLRARTAVQGQVLANGRPIAGALVHALPAHGPSGNDAITQDDGSFGIAGISKTRVSFAIRGYRLVAPTETDLSSHAGVVTIRVEQLGGS